jgi:hypothetical protein
MIFMEVRYLARTQVTIPLLAGCEEKDKRYCRERKAWEKTGDLQH